MSDIYVDALFLLLIEAFPQPQTAVHPEAAGHAQYKRQEIREATTVLGVLPRGTFTSSSQSCAPDPSF